jgi:hypothetical protein
LPTISVVLPAIAAVLASYYSCAPIFLGPLRSAWPICLARLRIHLPTISVALANQLLNAGLGNIKVGGRSADAAAIGALQAGKQAAWTATPYYVAGYGLVDSALRVMTQSSGIDKNAVPPFQILTVANTSAVTVPYNAPLNALQQYMRIWKR